MGAAAGRECGSDGMIELFNEVSGYPGAGQSEHCSSYPRPRLSSTGFEVGFGAVRIS